VKYPPRIIVERDPKNKRHLNVWYESRELMLALRGLVAELRKKRKRPRRRSGGAA